MGILSWVIVGVAMGLMAKFFSPGSNHVSTFSNLLASLAGAFVGGLLGWVLGTGGIDRMSFLAVLLAVVGSTVLLAVYHKIRKPRVAA
ncbi:MAG: GlsB/YeaQ/YmgE family stress response membrane protein [Dehalococcoidia bacterium]|nr:GlsB/YeaQ/YmgE family stress response membrane protein [Dehalococcoidia bacterium]